ncbi:RING finger protein 141-like [Pseudoliparis swirei]|uniref:RING finger protein 141-like n=1 Tax=Pseudoliparis swirei TaxID=2059687 RepID=UPI0024BE2B0A|nr:RING finger protein 141-like [Pseudoliparis swirei]
MGNRLLDGPGTTGLMFWKQNARRIIALLDSSYRELIKYKKKRKGGIDDEHVKNVEKLLRAAEALLRAAEALPAVTQTLKELGDYARANKVNTVALTDPQVTSVRATFQCLICQDVMDDPVVAQCCRSLIGCRVCVDRWSATSTHCPKCRDEEFSSKYFAITGMGEVVDVFRDTIGK